MLSACVRSGRSNERLLPGCAITVMKSIVSRPRGLFLDLIEIRWPRFLFRPCLCRTQDPGRRNSPHCGAAQDQQEATQNGRPASRQGRSCSCQFACEPGLHSISDQRKGCSGGLTASHPSACHDNRSTRQSQSTHQIRSDTNDPVAKCCTSRSYPFVTREKRRAAVPIARPRVRP